MRPSAVFGSLLAALLCVSLVVAGSGSASGAGFSCGQTITSPGVYRLMANLDCSAMPPSTSALTLEAGVTLDLQGYSIIGPGGTVPTFAALPTAGVQFATEDGFCSGGESAVKNGIIRGFDIGIYSTAGAFSQVSNMRLTRNGYGIGKFYPSCGLSVSNSFVNENLGDGVFMSLRTAAPSSQAPRLLATGGTGSPIWRHPLRRSEMSSPETEATGSTTRTGAQRSRATW